MQTSRIGRSKRMIAEQIHHYLRTFFIETNCKIEEETSDYLTVQLTADIDKRIMNRPFYWQFIESTKGEPNPLKVTFITKQKENLNIRGEYIHYGSMRMHQIFQATKDLGCFVQMYEDIEGASLFPWIGANFKVSYHTDQTKELLFSLGINLIHGSVKSDFQDILCALQLTDELPKNAYCLPYIVSPMRAIERLETAIENYIANDDLSWADEAKKRWKREQEILDHFYEDVENKPEIYEIEKKALEERFQPRIKIEIVSGGLFYLK